MRFKIPLSTILLSAISFAARKKEAPQGDIISQISSGFSQIMAGDLGLQLAVVIAVIVGAAIGYWKGQQL
jgi:hypothetical protein